MDFGALRRYARVRRNDIIAAVVAAVGVLAFGPLYGLLLAVAGSVLGLVYRSSRVDVEVMGKVPHEKAAWGSIRNHEERPTYPGVLVLRVDAPMFWVTAAPVQDAVLARVEAAPGTRALVLDLEATNQMDTTSADALADLLARAAQARHRPLPGPGDVAGAAGAAAVGADGRARRGPPVAQHLAGRPRGPPRARAQAPAGPGRSCPASRTSPRSSSSARRPRRSTSLRAAPGPAPRPCPAEEARRQTSYDHLVIRRATAAAVTLREHPETRCAPAAPPGRPPKRGPPPCVEPQQQCSVHCSSFLWRGLPPEQSSRQGPTGRGWQPSARCRPPTDSRSGTRTRPGCGWRTASPRPTRSARRSAPLPDPTAPISFPDNYPDEGFYTLANANLDTGNGGKALLVVALEQAFRSGRSSTVTRSPSPGCG